MAPTSGDHHGSRSRVETPLHRLPGLSSSLDVDVWAKREDLYPHHGGGNKARKFDRIVPVIQAQGCNALVTTGSTWSNHARCAALVAAQQGWSCHLVLHGNRADRHSLNGHMMRLAGASVEFVEPAEVRHRLEHAVAALRAEGLRPALVPGGGHQVEGTLAYHEVAGEITRQMEVVGGPPDVVVTASGTGSTHAGLHVGFEDLNRHTRVVGVSVARGAPRGGTAVQDACRQVSRHLDHAPSAPVEFHDEWTEGGYGHVSRRLRDAVAAALTLDGLLVDDTYTGKALLGLMDLVHRRDIAPGSRVVFVHTGGWASTTLNEEIE